MKKQIRWVLAFLLGYVLSGADSSTRADDSAQKLSKASVAASEAQTKAIRHELQDLKTHDWAGEYYFGDGLGVNVSLVLAPKSGFVFSWHGCLGLYDLNYGDVAFTNRSVRLLFKYSNKQEGFKGIAPELLPVRWGERHYLIPVNQVVDFTNAINAGIEPSSLFGGRSGRFLLRRGDEQKEVSGLPNIPGEYPDYLLREPIKAKISSVEQTVVRKSRRVTSVTLNVGGADGLKKGMEFYVHNPSDIFDSAVVTAVGEHSAQAVIEQTELSNPVPSTSWELSTKL
jgi:hypothetical protein